MPVHRPPDPSITATGPLTPTTGTLVRLRRTPGVHALGPKPRTWARRGIRGSARGVSTAATIETIIQLLFAVFPVADFRLIGATGFTRLVHGSHSCSTFCLGAGWRPGSYRRERQHAKRDLFHSHIAGGSQIAMEKARSGYPRLCTRGIDLRCRFSLTGGGG